MIEMNKSVLTSFTISCLLSTMFLMGLSFNIQTVKASGTIYIRTDGSVDPPTANITSADDVTYYFTDNNYDEIVVERSNIMIDGDGYTLQGAGSGKGIDLTATSNVTIKNMKIKAFAHGIWLRQSSNNKIVGSTIANNTYGVWIYGSNNTLSENMIANSSISGVVIDVDSSNNTLSGNKIINNTNGVWFYCMHALASDNKFYHNNFINNTQQVYFHWFVYANVWDDGYPSGGNYWSDYNGTDSDHDGIGDTPYIIDANNTDYHPLMGMFSDFDVTWEEQVYNVNTMCNSTILSSKFMDAITTLTFDVTGPNETVGFCRITIPKALMKGPYTVYIDANEVTVNELLVSNTTHAFLYFAYIHSTHTITIVSWTERYDRLVEDFQNLNATLYELLGNITDLKEEYDSLLTVTSDMQEQINSLNSTCNNLQTLIDDLQKQVDLLNSTQQISVDELQGQIESTNSTLTSGQDTVINELNNVRNLMYIFIATTIILIATTVYFAIRKPKTRPKRKTKKKP